MPILMTFDRQEWLIQTETLLIEDMPWTHQSNLHVPAAVLRMVAATDRFVLSGPTVSVDANHTSFGLP
jgi:hypothetical protein